MVKNKYQYFFKPYPISDRWIEIILNCDYVLCCYFKLTATNHDNSKQARASWILDCFIYMITHI